MERTLKIQDLDMQARLRSADNKTTLPSRSHLSEQVAPRAGRTGFPTLDAHPPSYQHSDSSDFHRVRPIQLVDYPR